MSSISSLQLKVPVVGQTTYVSPITDLLRHNSLAYSAFYSHASLEISNMKLLFSTDGVDFTEYKTITLDNDIRATGNELIPARYFKFEIENPDLNAMSAIDVFFTAFVTASSNIDVNIGADDIIISGVAQESTQLLVKSAVESTNNKITTCDTGAVVVSGSALPTGASTASKQTDIENKLIQIDNVLDQMKLDTAKIISSPSTEAKQDTANLTLTDISNNLTRVVPTDNSVGECLPVRLMVGSSGSSFNALRAIGQDLAVYIDDMNSDVALNSGLSTKLLQENTKTVIDDIDVGINKPRTTDLAVYTNSVVTTGDVTGSIPMNDGKDRYTQIQLVGDSATAGYKFILQYSTDGSNWFSDGVESSHYNNGSRYEFSVSRINISVPFIRVKSIANGATVNMSYSLTK